MAVPVDQELILGEPPDSGERQRAGIHATGSEPRSAGNGGEEEGATELVALRVQKLHRYGIEISHPGRETTREKGTD